MTNTNNHAVNTNALNKLKTELVEETVQSLLMLKKHHFDLNTEEGIRYAVNCTIDDLLQKKILNGELQICNQNSSEGFTR